MTKHDKLLYIIKTHANKSTYLNHVTKNIHY